MMTSWACSQSCCAHEDDRCLIVPLWQDEDQTLSAADDYSFCIIRQLVRQESVLPGQRAQSSPEADQGLGKYQTVANRDEFDQQAFALVGSSPSDNLHVNGDDLDDNDCPELTPLGQKIEGDTDECTPPTVSADSQLSSNNHSLCSACGANADDVPSPLQVSQQALEQQRVELQLGPDSGMLSWRESSREVPTESPVGVPQNVYASGEEQAHARVVAEYATPLKSRKPARAQPAPGPDAMPLPRWGRRLAAGPHEDLPETTFLSDELDDKAQAAELVQRETSFGLALKPHVGPSRRALNSQISAESVMEQSEAMQTPKGKLVSCVEELRRERAELPASPAKGKDRVHIPKLDFEIIKQRALVEQMQQAKRASKANASRLEGSSCCACLAFLDAFDPETLWQGGSRPRLRPAEPPMPDPMQAPPVLLALQNKDAQRATDLSSSSATIGQQSTELGSAHYSAVPSSRSSDGWSDLASTRLYYPPPVVREEEESLSPIVAWEELVDPAIAAEWRALKRVTVRL